MVIFDSNAPEGTGEGLYMQGIAEGIGKEDNSDIFNYKFVPEKIWINDEEKYDDGSYKHDIRVELDLLALKSSID